MTTGSEIHAYVNSGDPIKIQNYSTLTIIKINEIT